MRLASTVKAKLLMAFGGVLALNIAVGILAFRGFSETQTALEQLSDESLTDIVAAMTLAHESSALAALAPFVSSVRVMNELENESMRLSVQVERFAAFVRELPSSQAFLDGGRRERVQRLAADLSTYLVDLVSTTKDSLDVRADLEERRYDFGRRSNIAAMLDADGQRSSEIADSFRAAMDKVQEALIVEDTYALDVLAAEYATLSEHVAPRVQTDDTPAVTALGHMRRQAVIFDLQRRHLEAQQRVRFLLATIHSVSTQLNGEYAAIVETTSEAANQRGADAGAVLGRTKAVITLLGALAILAAAFSAFYVVRYLARHLEGVTLAMTRLAGGDRAATVPGLHRRDELGSLARAFDVFKEASFERESLARQVTENNRLVEAMFSNMNDGISVFDAAGRLASWNPQFLAMNGLTVDSVTDVMTYEDVARRFASMGGRAFQLGGQAIKLDGMRGDRQVAAAQFELHFGDGRVIEVRSQPMPSGGFVTSYTDQTERRGVDKQLREAQRMEAVGQLTGGIAHDFNNLLAAISGNLQLLHQQLYADEAISVRLLRALDATERASAVTQRLLAFARQQTLQPRSTDVNALVTSLLDLVEYSVGAGIEVLSDLNPSLEPIMVDPVQLENAILNLVFNSRDAMPDGGAIVIRTWSEASANGRQLCLLVEDDGHGMTPEVLARTFEPFFTTKEKGRGTGLGLSMVYGFIKQSGGEIAIESEPGNGTRVIIRLPVVTDTGTAPAVVDEATPPVPGYGETVLLVEDDPIMLATAADMLAGLGYTVVRASDAMKAMDEIDTGGIDLVFTDILLPGGMTGLDVANHAKRTRPGLAVVFTSGYAHDGPSKSIVLPPDATMLEKPYALQALARALRSALRASG